MSYFAAATARMTLAENVVAASDALAMVGSAVILHVASGSHWVIRAGATDAEIVLHPTTRQNGSWRTVKNFGYRADANAEAIVTRLLEVA